MSDYRSFIVPPPGGRIDPETYGRFLTGEATGEDHRALERWATTDQRRRLLDAKHDGAPAPGERTERAWSRLKERIALKGTAGSEAARHPAGLVPSRSARTAPRFFYSGLVPRSGARARHGYALACVAAAGCLLWLASGHLPRRQHPGAAARVFATGAAQRAVVTLGDGTRVMLDAGTRLRVGRDFATDRRVDLLDGEAQFTVTHHRAVPFVVRAGRAQVTVLGTTFTVRRSVADGRSRVVVVDGRVALRLLRTAARGAAVLGAGMLGEVVDTGAAPVVTPDVNVNDYTDWTRGRLVFRDTPLSRAIPELARRYGLVIRLADPSLGEQPISATLGDAPARDVLDLIAMSFDLRYTRAGDTVTFFHAHPTLPHGRSIAPLRSETIYGK